MDWRKLLRCYRIRSEYRNSQYFKFCHVLKIENIIDNTIGFLKFSRNYPIKISIQMLNKINDSGLTTLRSSVNRTKNVIIYVMKTIPFLPVVFIKILVLVKRLLKAPFGGFLYFVYFLLFNGL